MTFGLLLNTATPYLASIWEVWDIPVVGLYLFGNFFLSMLGILLTTLLFFKHSLVKKGLIGIGILTIGLGIYWIYDSHYPNFSLDVLFNWAVLPIVIHGAILTTLFRIKDG